ncbi:DUF6252 family protein [Flavobacterium sp. 3HN19-14]|uniref:DUF6252 family protein n=1 Tax=Flavobacterium sp. 3HN19-14 TaxID=3448133 RepID=UPI003EE374D2
MKKILSLLLLTVAFWSCESDVKFSDPGFQGRKDNFAWRADLSDAHFTSYNIPDAPNEGYLTINGYKGLEIVTLRIPFLKNTPITKFNPAEYQLEPTPDDSDDIAAIYTYEDQGFGLVYSTGQDLEHDESIGNATIVINDYDTVDQTVSGTFKFNAKYTGTSTVVNENVNFQEGAFYHVPIQ